MGPRRLLVGRAFLVLAIALVVVSLTCFVVAVTSPRTTACAPCTQGVCPASCGSYLSSTAETALAVGVIAGLAWIPVLAAGLILGARPRMPIP